MLFTIVSGFKNVLAGPYKLRYLYQIFIKRRDMFGYWASWFPKTLEALQSYIIFFKKLISSDFQPLSLF